MEDDIFSEDEGFFEGPISQESKSVKNDDFTDYDKNFLAFLKTDTFEPIEENESEIPKLD